MIIKIENVVSVLLMVALFIAISKLQGWVCVLISLGIILAVACIIIEGMDNTHKMNKIKAGVIDEEHTKSATDR